MKYRWPVGPAGIALLTLLCSTSGTARAATWTNLWSTREQQAQHLLDSKEPAAAAPLFSDPRRRAYAEMEAGQYAKAAKSLEPFKDADSQYNRGNALAHSGQLREALSAYDAALAASPGDKDVIRNRDLVRRALERQQQNQSGNQSGAQGRSGSQGSNGGQSQGGGQSQSGSQPQGGAQSQAGQGNPNQRGDQSQPNNQSQAANQHQNGGQSQPGSQPRGGTQPQPGQGNQNQRGDQSQPNNQSQAANQQGNQRGANQPQNGQAQGAQSQTGQPQGGQNQGAQSQAGQPESRNASQAANRPGNQQGGNEPTPGGQTSQSQAANQSGGQPPSQGAASTPSGAAQPGNNPSGEGALATNDQPANGSMTAGGLNAENAQQDADAALRYRQSQQGRAAPGTDTNNIGRATVLGPDGKTRSSAEVPPPKPPSEQSLALDQWLRGIPDDSGELLRRKFLIEHRLRQQANEQ